MAKLSKTAITILKGIQSGKVLSAYCPNGDTNYIISVRWRETFNAMNAMTFGKLLNEGLVKYELSGKELVSNALTDKGVEELKKALSNEDKPKIKLSKVMIDALVDIKKGGIAEGINNFYSMRWIERPVQGSTRGCPNQRTFVSLFEAGYLQVRRSKDKETKVQLVRVNGLTSLGEDAMYHGLRIEREEPKVQQNHYRFSFLDGDHRCGGSAIGRTEKEAYSRFVRKNKISDLALADIRLESVN